MSSKCPICGGCGCPGGHPCTCTPQQKKDFYLNKGGIPEVPTNQDPGKVKQYDIIDQNGKVLTPLRKQIEGKREQIGGGTNPQ